MRNIMRKRTILYLLCAILLVVVALTAMSCVSGNYQTNTYEINKDGKTVLKVELNAEKEVIKWIYQ